MSVEGRTMPLLRDALQLLHRMRLVVVWQVVFQVADDREEEEDCQDDLNVQDSRNYKDECYARAGRCSKPRAEDPCRKSFT